MTDRKKIQALVACQIEDCVCEVGYPLDMVRMYNKRPICEVCWDYEDNGGYDEDGNHTANWSDLPPVTMEDLEA